MSEQRNLILAIVISMAILLGFQFLFERPKPPPAPPQTAEAPQPAPSVPAPQTMTPPQPGVGAPPTVGGGLPAPAAAPVIDGPRVRIDTPSLHGSINLIGARFDRLTLVNYHKTPDPGSPEIELLAPLGSARPYFAEFGWVAAGAAPALPGPDSRWTADRDVLKPGQPVTLRWNNGRGLSFVRIVAVDQNYMFTVTERVENNAGPPVTLHPYSLVARLETPKVEGVYLQHEGPLGVLDGTLRERTYSDLKEKNDALKEDSVGGWVGITDKYWLVSLAPRPTEKITARFFSRPANGSDQYQVDMMGQGLTIQPGGQTETTSYLFAGAKVNSLLDQYAQTLGIKNFDLAIDFGWFYFLTKPFFHMLTFLNGFFGNFGIAILALTVIVKALFFPLANKSYQAMSKMKKLQPEMKKLQERFGDDKVRMNQELMALYKHEKVNPAAGCLPILIQIPVFFALYKVLFVTIEMRHAPFFGWIRDLSGPDPTNVFNLFGLIPWSPPEMLHIGIWPLLMGVTMWLQQKLNPQPADPMQARMFAFLPLIFTVMLANFSAGLVIYWAWNNILSIAQQWLIMRRMGVKV